MSAAVQCPNNDQWIGLMHLFDRDTKLCETAPSVYTGAKSENRLINKNPNGGYLIRPFLKPGFKEKLMLWDITKNRQIDSSAQIGIRHFFITRNIRRDHGL